MTPAEKQRAYRERQKAEKKAGLRRADGAADVFKTPFFEFLGDFCYSSSDFVVALDLAGIQPPQFEDDRGPEAYTLDAGLPPPDDGFYPFTNAKGSLGRAEVMVGCLIDAAADLAAQVNAYKRSEIKARLAEIEASDLSEPKAKKAALKEAARLNKMLDQLDRQVRWTFPQWKINDVESVPHRPHVARLPVIRDRE
jgi:hypothetical protein